MDLFLKGYPEAGCTTELLAMNTARHPVDPAILPGIYPQLARVTAVPVDNRVRPLPLLRNWAFSRRPSHAERFRSGAFAAALQETLRRFRPDVVHVESPFLAEYLPLIRSVRPEARTVLRMNNVEAQIWQRLAGGTAPGPRKWYLQSLARRIAAYERTAWPLFDAILPVTREDAGALGPYVAPDGIRVVPFCIDTAAIRPKPLVLRPDAYHLAAMDWLPNVEAVDWFVGAVWPRLQAVVPELHVHLAGRHMPQRLIDQSAGNLHISGAVDDAEAFAGDKPFLIVPLRSGGGIRVKILEAMAAGKAVISTSVGLQGIEASPGVDCSVADSPEGFALAFEYFLRSPGCVEKMIRNARRLVETTYDRRTAMAGLVAWLQERMPAH